MLDGFVRRLVCLKFTLFLGVALIGFFVVSCSPSGNGGDALIPDGSKLPAGDRELNAVNVLTGEAASFPGDWEGELLYLNFFMAT